MTPIRQAVVQPLSKGMSLLLAIACGGIVGNLYYAQPLVGPISSALHMSSSVGGFLVTLTQIGYCAGLLFVVPLGDLIENKRLVLTTLGLTIFALIAAALARHSASFLIASALIGIGSVAVQILVPYAAHLSAPSNRGKAVGNVMSGLLLGILLARPLASFVSHLYDWHAAFWLAALICTLLWFTLLAKLPKRYPLAAPENKGLSLSYLTLMRSLWDLMLNTPILQRRAAYHAALFGAFSLFWTTVPLLLHASYGFSQGQIAWFALAGVLGAIAAPMAGKCADLGWTQPATGCAIGLVIFSLILTAVAQDSSDMGIYCLIAAAILLDMGVSINLVLGQRAIFSLGANIRSRLNALYMAIFFIGGAIGSASGVWAYAYGGWLATLTVSLIMPCAALIFFLSEFRKQPCPAQRKMES